jgi:transposase-like protein
MSDLNGKVCPTCKTARYLIGRTSGAGPVQPWTCTRCGATWNDNQLVTPEMP